MENRRGQQETDTGKGAFWWNGPRWTQQRHLPAWLRLLVALLLLGMITATVAPLYGSAEASSPEQLRHDLVVTLLCTVCAVVVVVRPNWALVPLVTGLVLAYPEKNPSALAPMATIFVAIMAALASFWSFALALGLLLLWYLLWAWRVSDAPFLELVLGFLPLVLILVALGLAFRFLQARRESEKAEAEHLQARMARAQEEQRLQLARELHDLVAHGLTVIAMHSRAGTYTEDPTALKDSLDFVGDTSRSALRDLRNLVHVLRAGGENSWANATTSTDITADITATVHDNATRLNQLGIHTTTTINGEETRIPSTLRPTLKQFFTECTTNILKHAGEKAEATLTLTIDQDTVTAEATNTTPTDHEHFPASGYGLNGMAERAELLGGTFHAGKHDTRWATRARFPLNTTPPTGPIPQVPPPAIP